MGIVKKTAKTLGKVAKVTGKVAVKTTKVAGKIAAGVAYPPAAVALLGYGAAKGAKKVGKIYKDKGFVKGTAAAVGITVALAADEALAEVVGETIENN